MHPENKTRLPGSASDKVAETGRIPWL